MPKPHVSMRLTPQRHLTPPAEPRPGSAAGATPRRAALPGALSQPSLRTPCRGLLGKTSHTQVMKQVVPFRYSQYSAFAFFSQSHQGRAAPELCGFAHLQAGPAPCRGSACGGPLGEWRQPAASRGGGAAAWPAGSPGWRWRCELGAATPARQGRQRPPGGHIATAAAPAGSARRWPIGCWRWPRAGAWQTCQW